MNHWEELIFFGIIFFVIFIFWISMGGPGFATSTEGMYLEPPVATGNTGQVYGDTHFINGPYGTTTLSIPDTTIHFPSGFPGSSSKATIPDGVPHSALWGQISFDGTAGAKNTSASTEYLRIIASKNLSSPENITGFAVGSFASGNLATITDSAILPLLGSPYNESSTTISAGDTVIVSTGASPIGTSFEENKCSGFLNQLYSFTPAILKLCPTASALLTKFGPANDASCAAYAKTIPQCSAVPSSAVPATLSSVCKTFVEQTITYNGCVEDTQNDSDFYENEWRVFLGSQNELWGNSTDAIGLFDTKGGLVSGLTY